MSHRLCLGLLMLSLVAPIYADEIGEQIKKGEQAYTEKQYQKAIKELQFAIAQIQTLLHDAYKTLLPAPLDGWTANEAQAQTASAMLLGGGTQISRSYYAIANKRQRVDIKILADSPMLPALTMMLSNPMMLNANPDIRPYSYQGHHGVIEHKTGRNRYEIKLLIANRILVQVSAINAEDKAPVESYIKAIDLKRLEQEMLSI